MLGNSLILTLFGVFSVTRVRANPLQSGHLYTYNKVRARGKEQKLFLHEKEDFLHEKEDFLHEREDFPKIVPKNFDCREFFRNFALKQRNEETDRK